MENLTRAVDLSQTQMCEQDFCSSDLTRNMADESGEEEKEFILFKLHRVRVLWREEEQKAWLCFLLGGGGGSVLRRDEASKHREHANRSRWTWARRVFGPHSYAHYFFISEEQLQRAVLAVSGRHIEGFIQVLRLNLNAEVRKPVQRRSGR